MSSFELFSVIVSSLSLLLSSFSIGFSIYFNNKNTRITKKLNSANLETVIANRIATAKIITEDLQLYIAENISKIQNADHIEALQTNFNAKIENELCAYDEACSKYLDNKIDKSRFINDYKTPILQLFQNKKVKDILDSKTASKYKNLLKFYKEIS